MAAALRQSGIAAIRLAVELTSPGRCQRAIRPATGSFAGRRPTSRDENQTMPKLKTHKGAARRFKITGTGKFTRRKGNISHNRTRMSKQARRQIDEMLVVSKPGQRMLRKLMPYAGKCNRYHKSPVTSNQESNSMPRVKRGVTARARHKKIIDMAKGHKGQRHRVFRRANESVLHALDYAYEPPARAEGRLPPALDRAHQRGGAAERHDVQPPDRRPHEGRDRGRPQDARGPRRARARRRSPPRAEGGRRRKLTRRIDTRSCDRVRSRRSRPGRKKGGARDDGS